MSASYSATLHFGCRKVKVDCVLELASFWGDQDDPGPRAGSHDRPVEVEGPVLVRDFWGRSLDFHPLGDEIGQGLGFYRRALHELDVIAHKLDCPFRNPSYGVAVANNFSEWERGDD